MERISRKVGRCYTETKLKSFDMEVKKFTKFVQTSQLNDKLPVDINNLNGGQITDVSSLMCSYILYGVNEDGSLTWLGQIIDSSD